MSAPAKRIDFCPGYHAERPATPHELHDIYETFDVAEDGRKIRRRVWVGQLSKAAVDAIAKATGAAR